MHNIDILEVIHGLFDTLICEDRGWMLLHESPSGDRDVWRITIQGGDTELITLIETKLIKSNMNYKMAYDPNSLEYYILIEVEKEN